MLVVSSTIPRIRLTDSNNNPDYEFNNTNGVFNIRDTSNATNRFSIGTDGHVDVTGNFVSNLNITSGSNIQIVSLIILKNIRVPFDIAKIKYIF